MCISSCKAPGSHTTLDVRWINSSRQELTKVLQLKLDSTFVSGTSHRANAMVSHSTNLYAFVSCKLHSGRAYYDVLGNSGRLIIELPTGLSFPGGSVQIRFWDAGELAVELIVRANQLAFGASHFWDWPTFHTNQRFSTSLISDP